MGILILDKLNNITDKHGFGLYRDGGIIMFEKLSGPQTEKKKIIKIFKDCGLSIRVNSNFT